MLFVECSQLLAAGSLRCMNYPPTRRTRGWNCAIRIWERWPKFQNCSQKDGINTQSFVAFKLEITPRWLQSLSLGLELSLMVYNRIRVLVCIIFSLLMRFLEYIRRKCCSCPSISSITDNNKQVLSINCSDMWSQSLVFTAVQAGSVLTGSDILRLLDLPLRARTIVQRLRLSFSPEPWWTVFPEASEC